MTEYGDVQYTLINNIVGIQHELTIFSINDEDKLDIVGLDRDELDIMRCNQPR